eukprot:6285741-Amphidinium_carterae.1
MVHAQPGVPMHFHCEPQVYVYLTMVAQYSCGHQRRVREKKAVKLLLQGCMAVHSVFYFLSSQLRLELVFRLLEHLH